MSRLASLGSIGLLACSCLAWAQASEPCAPKYDNRNMIDYGPLVLRSLSGIAIDPNNARVPGVCIGIFTETAHELVNTTVTDEGGKFSIPSLKPGRYRLVARIDSLCVANIPIRVVRFPRGGVSRKIVIHEKPCGIDFTSYGSYK